VERVAWQGHVAVVLPAGMDFPPGFRILDGDFRQGRGPIHRIGRWSWLSYDRADGS